MTETTHEALLRQTAKADELLGYFQGHRDSLEADRVSHGQAMDAKIASVDSLLHNHPLLRQSPNQYGNLDVNGDLDGWIKNGAFTVTFSHVRDILPGTLYDDRPAEDQAIFDAMGITGQYFRPTIRVLRVDWSGALDGTDQWLMYPHEMWAGGVDCSMGAYARLLSGECRAQLFDGITADWGQCGASGPIAPGGYVNAHPYVRSATGSIEFFWPAVAQGALSFDRNAPRWSYFASPYGTGVHDNTI